MLDKRKYALRTQYLELNLIKQIIKYLIDNDHAPANCKFKYPIKKNSDSDTYCWTSDQVQEMIKLCTDKKLFWIKHVIIGLVNSGLRIGELIPLDWSDINLKQGFITIKDESKNKSLNSTNLRTTKSGKTRSLPVSKELTKLFDSIQSDKIGLVFRGPNGGKIKPDVLRKIFIREINNLLTEKYISSNSEKGLRVEGCIPSAIIFAQFVPITTCLKKFSMNGLDIQVAK